MIVNGRMNWSKHLPVMIAWIGNDGWMVGWKQNNQIKPERRGGERRHDNDLS